MEKTKKYYAKAMEYYCDGYIEKALEYCEKSLAISRDYSPALNLKGLIQYVRGNLEEAQVTWRINCKLNEDGISKKYLDDSKKDREMLELFTKGVGYYKEIKIHQALEVFKECEKSHFNVLNLWNYIAYCYVKLGEYDKCNHYINEILKIDKVNSMALATKKTLMDIGVIKKEVNTRKIYAGCIIAGLLLVLAVVYFNKDMIKSINVLDKFTKNKVEQNNLVKDNNATKEGLGNSLNNGSSKETAKEEQPKAQQDQNSSNMAGKVALDFEAVTKDLDNNDYEKLLSYLETYSNKDLTLNEKALLVRVEEKVKASGVEHFYNLGMSQIKNKDYKQAMSSFSRIYKYSEGNYLNQHIIYMLGFSYEKIYDIENANKYYELYINKYNKGDYFEATLYSLAIINKDLDKEKSKQYAKILVSEYENSQYNNTVIKSIINQ